LLLAVVWLEGTMAVVLNLLVGPWSLAVAQWLLKATLITTQLCTWALVACLLRFLLIYVTRRGRALLAAPA
jgi:thiosulfate reductase cytochrome b subunit